MIHDRPPIDAVSEAWHDEWLHLNDQSIKPNIGVDLDAEASGMEDFGGNSFGSNL